jgi:predicted small integral membrane protein
MDLSWMAWTWQTAVFFAAIAALLAGMTAWEWLRPGGAPRRGLLGILTTRGDRLFISLLAAAYIHLLWLALAGNAASGALWIASLLAAAFAALVFWKG